MMASRGGERVPVEIEHLSDDERMEKFSTKTPEEIVGWLNFLCHKVREIEEGLNDHLRPL